MHQPGINTTRGVPFEPRAAASQRESERQRLEREMAKIRRQMEHTWAVEEERRRYRRRRRTEK